MSGKAEDSGLEATITPDCIQLMTPGVGGEARDTDPAWQAGLTTHGPCSKGCMGHDSGAHTIHIFEP